MRIAFIVPGGLDRVSGGYIYDRLLIDHLRALGATVDVVALPLSPLVSAVAGNLSRLPGGLTSYDVVIEDELGHAALFLCNRRLRRAGVPIIALVHNLAHRPAARARFRLRAAIERRYLRTVDGAVAVCDSTLRDVLALSAPPATAVAPAGRDHVPASVDDGAVEARAAAAGPLRLLFVAAVVPAKGLHVLLEALARLPVGDVRLEVAGALDRDPGYVRRIRRQLKTGGLGDRVRLHGQLRGQALWALYGSSHVLALPSQREAYPLVAIEALAHGLPVLITDRGGAAEVIGAGAQGACLPPDDVAAWAAAVAAFAGDRRRLAAAGRAAVGRFHALNSWKETASRVLALCVRVRERATGA